MWRYQGRVLKHMPALLWDSTSTVLTVFAVGTFFIPQLAGLGITRWWALVPVALLFLYRVSKAHYKEFRQAKDEGYEKGRKELEPIANHAQVLKALIELHFEGESLLANVQSYGGTEIITSREQFKSRENEALEWDRKVRRLLGSAFGQGEVRWYGTSDLAGYPIPNIPEQMRRRLNRFDDVLRRAGENSSHEEFDTDSLQ